MWTRFFIINVGSILCSLGWNSNWKMENFHQKNLPSSSITCRFLVWSWHVWKYNTTKDGFFGHFLTQSCPHPLTTIIQTETQSVHGQAWAQQKAIYLQMAKREIHGGMVEEDEGQRTKDVKKPPCGNCDRRIIY